MAEKKKSNGALPWICAGAVLGIIIKLFVIDILHVSGTSMEPSLSEGSVVFVNKLAYGLVKPGSRTFFIQWAHPKENDVVIYLHEDKIVVKRCVATAGTHLDYLTDQGYTLVVGDRQIPLTDEQYSRMKYNPVIPDGYILAIGDHYSQSLDSRTYGFVSVKNIVGRVVTR